MRVSVVCFAGALLWLCSASAAPVYGPPMNLGPAINTEFNEGQCDISPDGHMLVFSSDRPGGFGQYDLWMSTWDGDGWGTPINLGEGINSEFEDSKVSFSPDGQTIYFRSNRIGGVGGFDIYQCRRRGNHWTDAELLPGPINTTKNEWASGISPNGVTFSSGAERIGQNVGYANIYFSEFADGEWGPLHRLEELASPYDMGGVPGPTPDQMVIDWDNPRGLGSYDLYWSERVGGIWQPPINLGPSINSPTVDWQPALSVTGDQLFFVSLRDGGFGGTDIWVCEREDTGTETYPFGDLNCDGEIDMEDVVHLIHHLHRGTPLVPCCQCDCQIPATPSVRPGSPQQNH